MPVVFGPDDIPFPAPVFPTFKGPDGTIFEYSPGVYEIEDEATHCRRQYEPTSFCMSGLQARWNGTAEPMTLTSLVSKIARK